ncbi:MAG: trimeric intracellular cation channel family protein [Actinomycetota bacterium]|jgi:uncharacterized membrane protein YeiH|nr:trimeric intracellular cation channel family protein [Actinomycetota bacterium]MDA3016198.1 trimeric intracellular cation channel family protein [Actinomycetota bacterium]MDA3027206.1 trimeric intracellular cation channel family protein [Actinomycetota bacterium]
MASGTDIVTILDFIGISVFAASGALLALERGFDLVGLVALGTVTALGGGVLRDVIINEGLPASFESATPIAVAVIAALVTVVMRSWLRRWQRTFLTFDAVGLALFAVTGSSIAIDADLGPVASILLGVLTATGGGVTRDVLARTEPQIFRADSTLYAIPAALGATTMTVWADADLDASTGALVGAAVVLILRLGAIHFGWSAPVPGRSRR